MEKVERRTRRTKGLFFHDFVRSLIEIPLRSDRTRIAKSLGTLDDVGYRFPAGSYAGYTEFYCISIFPYTSGILLKIVSRMPGIFRTLAREEQSCYEEGFDDFGWCRSEWNKVPGYSRDKIALAMNDKLRIGTASPFVDLLRGRNGSIRG